MQTEYSLGGMDISVNRLDQDAQLFCLRATDLVLPDDGDLVLRLTQAMRRYIYMLVHTACPDYPQLATEEERSIAQLTRLYQRDKRRFLRVLYQFLVEFLPASVAVVGADRAGWIDATYQTVSVDGADVTFAALLANLRTQAGIALRAEDIARHAFRRERYAADFLLPEYAASNQALADALRTCQDAQRRVQQEQQEQQAALAYAHDQVAALTVALAASHAAGATRAHPPAEDAATAQYLLQLLSDDDAPHTVADALLLVERAAGSRLCILPSAHASAAASRASGRAALRLLGKLATTYWSGWMTTAGGNGGELGTRVFGPATYRARESETVQTTPALRAARTFLVDGVPLPMFRHLAAGNTPGRALRIHFHPDRARHQIVVGWCGCHLPTTQTN